MNYWDVQNVFALWSSPTKFYPTTKYLRIFSQSYLYIQAYSHCKSRIIFILKMCFVNRLMKYEPGWKYEWEQKNWNGES